MTIDEAIAQEREKAKEQRYYANFENNGLMYQSCVKCAEYHEQLAEWLEELKALKIGLNIKCDSLNEALEKGKKIGYNKALDDFVNTVKATFPHDNIAICNTEVIAEQLKVGEQNE